MAPFPSGTAELAAAAAPHEGGGQQRQAELVSESRREERGLIESSAGAAPPVQRHRHDRVGAGDQAGAEKGAEMPGELFAERPAEVVEAVEFQLVDQPPNRAVVFGGPHKRAQVAMTKADARGPEHPVPAGETHPSTLAPREGADAEQAVGRKQGLQTGSGETARSCAES